MKQLCSNCEKRTPVFISKGKKAIPGVHSDKRHDLCRQCYDAMKESRKEVSAGPA